MLSVGIKLMCGNIERSFNERGNKMSMKYIRETYHIPIKRGMLVCWHGHLAKVTSATNHIRLRFVEPNGVYGARTLYVHPTDDIAYMLPWQQWLFTDVSAKTLGVCNEHLRAKGEYTWIQVNSK